MNESALERLRDPHAIQAAEVYPFALPSLRHNEAHRLVRRAMECGGEVVSQPGGFLWTDDSWFADASVSVVSAEDNTAVTVLIDRRLESLACRLGLPLAGAVGASLFALQFAAFVPGLLLPFGLAGILGGAAAGLGMDRWLRDRWRRRAWAALEGLGVLASEGTPGPPDH